MKKNWYSRPKQHEQLRTLNASQTSKNSPVLYGSTISQSNIVAKMAAGTRCWMLQTTSLSEW